MGGKGRPVSDNSRGYQNHQFFLFYSIFCPAEKITQPGYVHQNRYTLLCFGIHIFYQPSNKNRFPVLCQQSGGDGRGSCHGNPPRLNVHRGDGRFDVYQYLILVIDIGGYLKDGAGIDELNAFTGDLIDGRGNPVSLLASYHHLCLFPVNCQHFRG